MLYTSLQILNDITENGVDDVLSRIRPEDVEDGFFRIIIRTIQQSKQILVEQLKEFAKEETEDQGPLSA